MSTKPKKRRKSAEITDWERGKRKPPRQAEFKYKLGDQRYRLAASVPVVEAAMSAYARTIVVEESR